VALIVAVIGMPFVLYTAGVYWIFRGKATATRAAIRRRRAPAPAPTIG
jgi:cytochrome bd-type quinol oxidase subunit 2